tara:strand:- start:273 stop:641 length:369 start_codon:yes stop_codon:yes gene_type:complete
MIEQNSMRHWSLSEPIITRQLDYNSDICNYVSITISEDITKTILDPETTNDELCKLYRHLNKCDCCKRHTSGRPIKCCKDSKNSESLYHGGPNKIQLCFDKIICDCSCRQLMRSIVCSMKDN